MYDTLTVVTTLPVQVADRTAKSY